MMFGGWPPSDGGGYEQDVNNKNMTIIIDRWNLSFMV
jgi:hypothetical protein